MEMLVRDKIPFIMEAAGMSPKYRIAEDDEKWERLKNKLIEKSVEVFESEGRKSLVQGVADLQTILDEVLKEGRISYQEIIDIQVNKNVEKGRFQKGYILEVFDEKEQTTEKA